MKKQTTCENNKIEQFEIREPRWVLWVCLLATIGFAVAAIVTFCLGSRGKFEDGYGFLGGLFVVLSLFFAWGTYVWTAEKLTYANRVYAYHRWYGKKQVAKVSEISKVKFLTICWHHRGRFTSGVNSKQRIFFYNDKKEILIKFNDGDIAGNSEVLLRSLKVNRIKIVRETKWVEKIINF